MLVFIIPLKSKHKCKSWKLVSNLCLRTIKSACAQQNPQFHIIVVCNEAPDLDSLSISEKQKLLVISTPYCHSDKNPGFSGTVIKLDIAAEHDKANKLKIGFDTAVNSLSATHFMALDADDCVSNKLSGFPYSHPECAGWFAEQGYVYSEGSRYLFRKRKSFQSLCGSSLIVRTDLWHSTFREENGYLFYNHGTPTVNRLKLEPLPFPASIYSINNGENYHMSNERKKDLIMGSHFAKLSVIYRRLINYRVELIRKSHAENYGFYKVKG